MAADRDPLSSAEDTAQPPNRLAPGTRLGPYEIRAFVGAGGMGQVYRARDDRLSRDVAIKVLTDDRLRDPADQRRLEEEARTIGGLNHSNILSIYDVGTHDGAPFVVMELLEGNTLRALLSQAATRGESGLSPERAWHVAAEISLGLAAAHRRGIVHRDLKPENVFIAADGRVKILDFGLARTLSPEGQSATETATVVGTVGYMAPEQIRAQRTGPPADVFALGVVFYELLCGRRPFDRGSAADTLSAILNEAPTPLGPSARVSLAASAIIERCLAKDPTQRFGSATELAVALHTIDPPSPTPDVSPVRAASRAVMVGVGAAALVVGLSIFWWQGRSMPTPSAVEPEDSQRRVVAVMPFKNLSLDVAQAYFAAGMTEEIHSQLSRVSALRLLSRSATDAMAAEGVDAIAEELGAGSVVEGSVRVDAGRARISVQLIDGHSRQAIWAEQYDRQLSDIFVVQGDVASQIASALRATLTADEQTRVSKPPTSSLGAYDLYLRAEQLTFDRAPNERAVGMLTKALALDPNFAGAHALWAYRSVYLYYFGDAKRLERSLQLARQAVQLDPNLDEAHAVLGSIYFAIGQAANARLAFLRALELNPNEFMALGNLSLLETELGRADEALIWAKRAYQRAPNLSVSLYHVGIPLVYAKAAGPADEWLRQAERRFPTSVRIRIVRVMREYEQGRGPTAFALARALSKERPDNEEAALLLAEMAYLTASPDALALIAPQAARFVGWNAAWWSHPLSPRVRHAGLLKARGEASQAAPLFAQALRDAEAELAAGNQSPRVPLQIAAVYAATGRESDGIVWLQRGYDAGWRYSRVIRDDPNFAALESNASYRELLARMDSETDAMRQRAATIELPALPEESATTGRQ